MKEYLTAQLPTRPDPLTGRHMVREALQAKILSSLQRSGAMIPLAFHGGTSLRFLYSIRRYSEDLDFALERADRGYDFRSYLQSIKRDLEEENFSVGLKVNDRKVVYWRDHVRSRLEAIDWARAAIDVDPFLESREEADLVTLESAQSLLGRSDRR